MNTVMTMSESLKNEIDHKQNKSALFRRRLEVLTPLKERLQPRVLQKCIIRRSQQFPLPPIELLRAKYTSIVERLNRAYLKETIRTSFEIKLEKMLKTYFSGGFHKSVWIGNHIYDFFIPQIGGQAKEKGQRSQGLAIEVDGQIHDCELKGRKDSKSLEFLHDWGIACLSVDNSDAKLIRTANILRSLRTNDRLDTRAKCRVWSRVYIVTLLTHGTSDDIVEVFGFDVDSISNSSKSLTGAQP